MKSCKANTKANSASALATTASSSARTARFSALRTHIRELFAARGSYDSTINPILKKRTHSKFVPQSAPSPFQVRSAIRLSAPFYLHSSHSSAAIRSLSHLPSSAAILLVTARPNFIFGLFSTLYRHFSIHLVRPPSKLLAEKDFSTYANFYSEPFEELVPANRHRHARSPSIRPFKDPIHSRVPNTILYRRE